MENVDDEEKSESIYKHWRIIVAASILKIFEVDLKWHPIVLKMIFK